MSSGSSNKPIVFVFGAKKGDTDARKRNLSAINTQVAYCAHERRREKNLKSRQRAQTKEEEKVDDSISPPVCNLSPASSFKAESVVDFNQSPSRKSLHQSNLDNFQPSSTGTSLTSFTSTASATSTPTTAHGRPPAGTSRPAYFPQSRRQSDLVSNVSSDRDILNNDVWSTSPTSAQQSTPTTELSSFSPHAPVSINGYFDSALDPFFKLPAVASDREKWLVHFCTSLKLLRPAHYTDTSRFSRDGPCRIWYTFKCSFLSGSRLGFSIRFLQNSLFPMDPDTCRRTPW